MCVVLAGISTQAYQQTDVDFKPPTDEDEYTVCTAITHQNLNICGPWGQRIPLLEDEWVSGPTCITRISLQSCTETLRAWVLSNPDSSTPYWLKKGVSLCNSDKTHCSSSAGIRMSNRLCSLCCSGQRERACSQIRWLYKLKESDTVLKLLISQILVMRKNIPGNFLKREK